MLCFKPILATNGNQVSIALQKRFHEKKKQKSSFSTLQIRQSQPSKISTRMESTAKISDVSPSLILTSGATGRVNVLLSRRALKSLVMILNGILMLLILPFRLRKRRVSSPVMEKSKDEKIEISHRKVGPVLRVPAVRVSKRSNAMVLGDQDVVTRRELAIKRVKEDEDGNSVREISLFVTTRGDTLFTQSWTPVSVKVRGLVVLLHGLNEHSGRYDHFAKQLNANGYKVYGMDWIGHGGSDGLHAYVPSLDDAVSDTKAFLEKVLEENPGFPCFFFGHSTGGAIILKAVLDQKIKALIQGMVLTSPAIRVQPSHPIFGVLAPIFSFLLPKYQFSAANKQGLPVSRDPDALVAKYSDPLVYTGSIRIRTGSEILRVSSYLQQNLSKISIPFLVLHGTSDTVTDPEATQKLYKEASSTDKSIKLYEGFLHDLLFEPEREAIAKDIIDWLNSKVAILTSS
ncbi:uncharacterized protein LOC143863222 [Tasmannia lanceolata]|uniref:uncharacterized protein LOC143863222 n=1 Tax=Tasmannia lanceolata TaxID=3420 RepID=UPI0040645CD7